MYILFFLLLFLEPTESLKSSVLADIEMDPDELTELARKRRMILSNDRLQRRNKRSLSTYDLYDINPVNQYPRRNLFRKKGQMFFFK